MKTRKALLCLILPALLLLESCVNRILEGYHIFYAYNFMHEKNDVQINSPGTTHANPYVMLGDTDFDFQLYTGGEHKWTISGNQYTGGAYGLSLSVISRSSQLKSIKTVTLNHVTIRVGDNEFNMVERIKEISPSIRGEDEKIFWGLSFSFSEEDITGVHSTGIIDIEAHKEKFYDLPAGTRTRSILIAFHEVPIDYTKYKEILLYFDITVEYITGETVRLEQEFLGILKERRTPMYRVLST